MLVTFYHVILFQIHSVSLTAFIGKKLYLSSETLFLQVRFQLISLVWFCRNKAFDHISFFNIHNQSHTKTLLKLINFSTSKCINGVHNLKVTGQFHWHGCIAQTLIHHNPDWCIGSWIIMSMKYESLCKNNWALSSMHTPSALSERAYNP